MSETKQAVPEKRVLPYNVWHDRDGGAVMDDAHGRLVAMFGYHPDGTPAMAEAKECMVAVNFHERLVEALLHQVQRNHEFSEWCGGCEQTRTLLSEIEKAAE